MPARARRGIDQAALTQCGLDPRLEGADEVVRGLYEMSLHRPLTVKDTNAEYRITPRKKGRRG